MSLPIYAILSIDIIDSRPAIGVYTMDINIRKATRKDTALLTSLRLDYLREDYGNLRENDERLIRSQLGEYFSRHIGLWDFAAILAEVNGKIAGCAFLVACEKPANLSYVGGKTGTVLNVLTYPEYRGHGVASQVIAALIQEAKTMGVSLLELNATANGKPLYEKFGFAPPHYTAMRLRLS
jgi:GNAT superfamily N-acetyltransferase